MKTILASYDPNTGDIEVVDSTGLPIRYCIGEGLHLQEYKEPKQGTNVVELVAAGMTADDIIKLKHGGVL